MSLKRLAAIVVETTVLYVSIYPVLYLIGQVWLNEQMAEFLLLLLIGTLLGYGLSLVRIKVYLEHGLVLLASVAGGYLLFGLSVALLAVIAAFAFIMNRSAWIARGSGADAFPIPIQVLGVISYLLIPILGRVAPDASGHMGVHFALGFAAVAALYFRVNHIQLSKANLAADARGVSAAVKLRNRAMVTILLAGILLIVQLKALKAWLERMWESFIRWLNEVLPKGQDPHIAPEPPPDAGMGIIEQLRPEDKPSSPFWQAVQEFFINGVALLIVLGITGMVIYLFVKKGIPWFAALLSGMNKERELSNDYEDLTEKLDRPQFGQAFRSALGRLRVKRDAMPEDDRERVRLRYKQMLQAAMKDGYEHKASYTPNEAEAELERIGWRKQPAAWLTSLYNQVRYGDKPVSGEDKQRLEQK